MSSKSSGWWLVLAGIVLGALLAAFNEPQRVMELLREGGFIEMSTAVSYFALAPLVWLLRRRDEPAGAPTTLAALSVVFIAFGAREMDWHKQFTGTSVLRVSWYYGPAPLRHKLVALVALALFVLALGWLLKQHARHWWQSLRAGDPVAHSIAAFLVALVVAKMLDRSYNILVEDFAVPPSMAFKAIVSAVEECLELALTLTALLALWQHRLPRQADPAGQPRPMRR